MVKKTIILPILLLILILSLFLSGCVTQQAIKNTDLQNKEKTIVTKIIDGDTVVIQGGEHVRLLGIDTPEKGEPYYSDAKNYLETRVFMKEVYIESDAEDKDQYDRLLRYIWLDDSLVNLEIVQHGLAIARFYDNMKYKTEIQEAEALAINQKIGIWSQLDNNQNNSPQTRASIDNQVITLNNTDVIDSTLTDDSCVSLGCPQGTLYVASKNSDKYHKCSCSFAKRISQQNLVCFSSKEEAEKNHQACSSCKP